MFRAVRAFSKCASHAVTAVPVAEVSTGRSVLVSVIEALQVVGFGGPVLGPNPPSISRVRPLLAGKKRLIDAQFLDRCLEFVEASKR